MIDRRKFLQASVAAALATGAPVGWVIRPAGAAPAAGGLADPAAQPKFAYPVPDALSPGFKFQPNMKGEYRVSIAANKNHLTGLVGKNGKLLKTTIFGYSDGDTPTWPGKTFEVTRGDTGGVTKVHWANDLVRQDHMLPVDTSMHWCYSLPGYDQYSIPKNGVPIITHLHGGHTPFQFDGNPEFFYSPDGKIRGPQWNNVPGGFTQLFEYDNEVPAGNLWYHDHALGITRLNVYAGLAGFFFVRDGDDTGQAGNALGLPAWPYEKAYAIQDRMFHETGDLFYPAYPGDPFYADFIDDEGATLPPELFPGGGPTGLAEFFGDHMIVNGIIWPYEAVEPRNYRLRLLNGTDSRFMVLQLRIVDAGVTDPNDRSASAPIPFHVIGSDQGLASAATEVSKLVFEPGSRYDIVVDFSGLENKRIIMENIGGDEPFGGDIPGPQAFGHTDRVMAFDVLLPRDNNVPDNWSVGGFANDLRNPSLAQDATARTVRKVALFEGTDEFGRLQPLLGTVDDDGNSHAYTWFEPTTENPDLGALEDWEIYNFTGDAHPIHLHLVHFETLGRHEISATEDGMVPTAQHNGTHGEVASFTNVEKGVAVSDVGPEQGYVETSRKDMVTALPEQVTTIRVSPFDREGRYVWHCHILSHEDHEMMRVLHIGPGA